MLPETQTLPEEANSRRTETERFREYQEGEELIFGFLERETKEIQKDVCKVKKKGSLVLRCLKELIGVLREGFEKEGYGHHYRGRIYDAFAAIEKANKEVQMNSSKNGDGYGILPFIDVDAEWKEFKRILYDASRRDYMLHENEYW
jgi:hypothetical protein